MDKNMGNLERLSAKLHAMRHPDRELHTEMAISGLDTGNEAELAAVVEGLVEIPETAQERRRLARSAKEAKAAAKRLAGKNKA
eukprot:jgi/Tetstr1/458882/TSEL_004390.t1